jgi:hypothetical protein
VAVARARYQGEPTEHQASQPRQLGGHEVRVDQAACDEDHEEGVKEEYVCGRVNHSGEAPEGQVNERQQSGQTNQPIREKYLQEHGVSGPNRGGKIDVKINGSGSVPDEQVEQRPAEQRVQKQLPDYEPPGPKQSGNMKRGIKQDRRYGNHAERDCQPGKPAQTKSEKTCDEKR